VEGEGDTLLFVFIWYCPRPFSGFI